MKIITKEVYEEIQKDLPKIEEQLNTRNGSQKLWNKLKPKYSILLPGIMAHISKSSKMGSVGVEFDYRPELIQLKESILSYLIINPVEKQSDEMINNDAEELLTRSNKAQEDTRINELIEESKLYMRSDDSNKKQIALEKIWDAFERLKTIYGENDNKKESVQKLIDNISHGTDSNKKMFNTEFNELTRIGNEYQIRHFEKVKQPIPSDDFREYLYFRVLSLISYCIQ